MKNKIMVEVLKLAGEIGLRKPGSRLRVNPETAQSWVDKGFVKLVDKPKVKKKSK